MRKDTVAGGCNPLLPFHECIPDGEPHIFGDRLYLFGSHDMEGGSRYCAGGDYIGWSAALSDPTDWECAGVLYEAKQDPGYMEGETNDLYAPDVVQGNDGRFYLYYNLVCSGSPAGFHDRIGVAVSDRPDGKYEYYGDVRNADGSVHYEYLMSDPAVINDEGTIRLYCGWSLSMVSRDAHNQGSGAKEAVGAEDARRRQAMQAMDPKDMLLKVYQMLFHREKKDVEKLAYPLMGANAIELEDDMLTVRGQVKRILPGQFDATKESGFQGHAFYEASSMRKIGDRYYFIYSSENSNELCYATSKYPDRDFTYGGVIISNGDVGYEGRKPEERTNMTANNHGSLECIDGQWYIFYHRQTHKSTFSRQACAEPITIAEDGSIAQVSCSSMGLRKEPFIAEGTYPSVIACLLTNGHMPHCTSTTLEEPLPNITHKGETSYIAEISDRTMIGYKYFLFDGVCTLKVTYRGQAEGKFIVKTREDILGELPVLPAKEKDHDLWRETATSIESHSVQEFYLIYEGSGEVDFLEFSFTK